MQIQLGTLIRCPDITEERLKFYQETGLTLLQLAGVNEEYLAPGAAAEAKSDALFESFKKYSLSVPCMFLSFPGQDWSRPLDSVGFTPMESRGERLLLACRQMLWGRRYGIRYVSCHVGNFPARESADYSRFLGALRQLAMFAELNGQEFLLESGMESAETMQQIMAELAPAHAMLNFDPANLLIYNQSSPDEFLDKLEDRVRIVHCKDAMRPKDGEQFGRESVLGAGETNFASLLKRLLGNGFSGCFVIERELLPGEEQQRDIAAAVELINNICQEVQHD